MHKDGSFMNVSDGFSICMVAWATRTHGRIVLQTNETRNDVGLWAVSNEYSIAQFLS